MTYFFLINSNLSMTYFFQEYKEKGSNKKEQKRLSKKIISRQRAKVGSKVQGLRIFCFTDWKENQHTVECEP